MAKCVVQLQGKKVVSLRRVHNDTASELVDNEGWKYLSKDVYDRNVVGEDFKGQ